MAGRRIVLWRGVWACGLVLACAWPARAAISVGKILELHQVGLDGDLLVEHIRKQGITFTVSAEVIVRLKKAGIGEAVIGALIEMEPVDEDAEIEPEDGAEEPPATPSPAPKKKPDTPPQRPAGSPPTHEGPRTPQAIRDLLPRVRMPSPAIDELMRCGKLCLEALLFREAAACYRKATEKRARAVEAWMGLGLTQRKRGRVAHAIEAFEEVLKLDAGHVAARIELGDIYLARGDGLRASKTLGQGVKAAGDNAKPGGSGGVDRGRLAYLHASALAQLGNRGEGLLAAQQAVKHDPRGIRAWLLLATLYRRAGQLDAAKAAMNKLTALELRNVPFTVQNEIDFERGRLHLARGEAPQAVKAFDESGMTRPSHVPSRLYKALALVSAGRSAEAAAAFERILRANSKSVEAHVGLGRARFDRQEFRAALKSFRKAAKLSPDHAPSNYNLAMTALKLAQQSSDRGLYRESLRAFGAYLQLEPVGRAADVARANTRYIESKLAPPSNPQ